MAFPVSTFANLIIYYPITIGEGFKRIHKKEIYHALFDDLIEQKVQEEEEMRKKKAKAKEVKEEVL